MKYLNSFFIKRKSSQLSEILKDSGEVGEFNLGNLKITIKALNTFEKELI